jgi:ubiquinol-cytochrome c reductase cytochrome c subunit
MRDRLRLLSILPLLAAVGTLVWGQTAQAAAPEGPGGVDPAGDDPLGYVIDVDNLDDPDTVDAGLELYTVHCVSCHGPEGAGGRGPGLANAGAASAHFYLTSGRMPQANLEGQSRRKRSPFTATQIEALVAYVASISDGPDIPILDLDTAELSEGAELYLTNCAACHQAAGSGGALSFGRNAPPLDQSTPVQVASAMRVGPGQMPVFGPEAFDDHEVNAIAAYVDYLADPVDPGGFSLGRVGPVTEGFVAIVLAGGATLVAAAWIGKRRLETSDDDDVTAQF